MESGCLYIVATPIGNLGDMVPRAVEVLQAVDLIAAEDTRHSARLFSHFAINGQLVSYHDHNESDRAPWLVGQLELGKSVALVSDAGTPLISDPGYRLVAAARQAGFRVVPIPGACALTAALSASGLPSDRFVFEGFLPARPGQRRGRLEELVTESRTLILYESPHRIVATLEDIALVLGADRQVVVARELTKTYETICSLPASEMLDWIRQDANQQRGEIVLLAAGAPQVSQGITPQVAQTLKILVAELPQSKAAAIAAKLTGIPRKVLYNALQRMQGDHD